MADAQLMKILVCLLFALVSPALVHAEVLIRETFDYPDGPLVQVASEEWRTHSGTEAQTQVLNSVLFLAGSATEDLSRAFSPVGLTSGIVHVGFDLTTTRLPSASGSYFFHFKDANPGPSSLFLGRLFASTTDAAPGHFRIGIAWGTGTPVTIPSNLPTNTVHRLVVSLDLTRTNAIIRINPPDEHSTADFATSSDLRHSGIGMSHIAFRQATGMGNHQVRNVIVSTRFTDVIGNIPPDIALLTVSLGPDATPGISFPANLMDSGYQLETSERPETGWEPGPEPAIEAGTAMILVDPAAPQRFYRLHRR